MGRVGLEHRDIALQQMQDILRDASDTMTDARAALNSQEISQLTQAKHELNHSEEALQHTYQIVQQLLSEGKASSVDFQNVQQVLHQVNNLKFKLNHWEKKQEGGPDK